MVFKPAPEGSTRWGLSAVFGLLVMDALLLTVLLHHPVDFGSFLIVLLLLLSLVPLAWLGYRTYGSLRLHYRVERDGVLIVWGTGEELVPMSEIREVVRGAVAASSSTPWWIWPGRYVGLLMAEQWGTVASFATRPLEEQILLVTSSGVVGISPADTEGFLDALQARYRLGPAQQWEPGWHPFHWWAWPFWYDRVGLALLGGGLVLALSILGYFAWHYPHLPGQVPLHLNAAGEVDRWGPRKALFLLPFMGAAFWTFNAIWGLLIWKRQRPGAYLLWAGALVAELFGLLALRSLLK
ncbi:MAG TPA: DUF1648 domain-containing protein [Anaerolineae bacterium]|nr:DUF1648 domain-containing protein [Anaerolineae bacterium]HIQ05034.1 DUF1648 domain-containing protein [Anaerolineae bacterium]